MAPKTKRTNFLLIFSTAFRAGSCLLYLVAAAFLPLSVSAAPLRDSSSMPDLSTFVSSVENGNGSVLSGVYINGLFALPVVQQPGSNAGYVSTVDNTLTQFSMASQFGNTGLLAHNYLSGQYFSQLMPGMRVQLVSGDGSLETFNVTHVYRYRATAPYSVTSDFVDLDTQEYLTAMELFTKVYKGPRHVTFQTCINQNGNSSWGRLFVIAEPEQILSIPTQNN